MGFKAEKSGLWVSNSLPQNNVACPELQGELGSHSEHPQASPCRQYYHWREEFIIESH